MKKVKTKKKKQATARRRKAPSLKKRAPKPAPKPKRAPKKPAVKPPAGNPDIVSIEEVKVILSAILRAQVDEPVKPSDRVSAAKLLLPMISGKAEAADAVSAIEELLTRSDKKA